ncbi:MAG: DinB family protein [Candidatus Limnocylindrales bacterium]
MSPGAALRRAELVGLFAASRDRIERAARAAERGGDATPGEWSAREVVLHLVAVERDVFQARLDDLETGDDPHWTWVEPGTADGPGGETLDGAIARFGACRGATLRRVGALDEAGWLRSGTHETYGVLDVGGLLRLAHDHDLDHLATLERMAAVESSDGAAGAG